MQSTSLQGVGSSSQILHPSLWQTNGSKEEVVFAQKSNDDQSGPDTSGHPRHGDFMLFPCKVPLKLITHLWTRLCSCWGCGGWPQVQPTGQGALARKQVKSISSLLCFNCLPHLKFLPCKPKPRNLLLDTSSLRGTPILWTEFEASPCYVLVFTMT